MNDLVSRDEPARTALKEYALLAPRLLKLIWRLLRDPRVPARSKAMLVVMAGYLASPIDVIPDIVPGFGQIDDLILAAFALDQILNRIPAEVVLEHWEGDEDLLEVIRQILDIATSLVPRRIKRIFARG